MASVVGSIGGFLGNVVGFVGKIVVGTIMAVGSIFGLSRATSGVPSSPNSIGTSYQVNPLELSFDNEAPRRLVYGKAQISGVVVYANVSGDGYEYLWLAVVIAAHPIQSVDQIYFDGDSGPDNYAGFYDYWIYDGTQTTVDPNLHATFAEWTSDCLLLGCAYAVIRLKYDKTVWKNGRPNITFDVKGKKVFDHRSGLTEWSNNAALCIADFMTSLDGLGATSDEMDWESVDAAADISDQIPAGMTASLCDGRYTIDGVVELSTKNGDTISAMLSALAGTVVWTEGKYRLYAGASQDPVSRVLTSEDLRDNPTLQPNTSSDQSFNGVKGTFLDSTNGWVFNDFPPVLGADYVEEDGGVPQFKDIVLNFTTSPLTAQRLATIFLRRARLEKTITLPCKWTCFNYEVQDVIPITLPALGWSEKQFQVTDWKMTPPTNTDAGGIDLQLVEYSPDIYSDDMDLKPIDPGGTIGLPDVTQAKPVSILYATSDETSFNPDTQAPRIRFDWPTSTDIYCVGYEIAYAPYPFTPTDISQWISIPSRTTISYTTPDVTAGTTYIGYIRTVNSYGNKSAFTASAPVLAQSVGSEYPENLIGLTATIIDDNFLDLTWVSPTGAAKNTAIFWSPDDDFANASLISLVAVPQNSIRLQREAEDGYYFACFVSAAGLQGATSQVFAAARPFGTILQELTLSKYKGDLTNAIWYNSHKAVVQSQVLASDLGWEVFDMMVPQPYSHVEYWAHNSIYSPAAVTLKVDGYLGWNRAPNVPGLMPVVNAQAWLAHFDYDEYISNLPVTLTDDANIKLGFKVDHSEVNGVTFTALNAKLENVA